MYLDFDDKKTCTDVTGWDGCTEEGMFLTEEDYGVFNTGSSDAGQETVQHWRQMDNTPQRNISSQGILIVLRLKVKGRYSEIRISS